MHQRNITSIHQLNEIVRGVHGTCTDVSLGSSPCFNRSNRTVLTHLCDLYAQLFGGEKRINKSSPPSPTHQLTAPPTTTRLPVHCHHLRSQVDFCLSYLFLLHRHQIWHPTTHRPPRCWWSASCKASFDVVRIQKTPEPMLKISLNLGGKHGSTISVHRLRPLPDNTRNFTRVS